MELAFGYDIVVRAELICSASLPRVHKENFLTSPGGTYVYPLEK